MPALRSDALARFSLVLLLVAAGASGCNEGGAPDRSVREGAKAHSPAPRSPALARNVLLLTLDTTRRDALGCYGGAAPTPHLDRLAAEGTLFEHAHTVTPVTLPAHTSLLTGTYPPYHGLRDNGLFRLVPEAVTFAELARDAGLATAAFVSAFVLDRQFGLNQGFSRYDDQFQVGFGGTLGTEERDARAVTDGALGWLGAHRGDPFLLWVHYYDPHQPLHAPEPFASSLPTPYLAEVAYMDSQIGRLLDFLHDAGLEQQTLVVAVADHGESLGEHGEPTHGIFLYEATLSVPLIVRGPRVAAGRRLADRVSLPDLAPTILRFLGIKPPATTQGRSLTELLTGDATLPEAPLYMETYLTRYTYGWAPLHAVIERNLKYIDAPRPELYDLAADPSEEKNLVTQSRKDAKRLARTTKAMLEHLSPKGGVAWAAATDLSEASRETLAQLGYLSAAAGDARGGIDPKDGLEETLMADRAMALQRRRRFDEAVALYRQILQRNPANRWVLQHLGSALVGAGRDREGIECLEQAIKVRRIIGPPLFNLAVAYQRTGRRAEALVLIEEIRAKNPKFTPAHQWLGRYHEKRGEWQEAIEAYRAFLEHWQGEPSIRRRIEAKVRELEGKL